MLKVAIVVIALMSGFTSLDRACASENFHRTEHFLSEEDKNSVRQFIVDFDEKTISDFMRAIREQPDDLKFEEVHPLKFVAFIFSDIELRERIRHIMEDKGKANVFLTFLRMQIDKAKKAGVFDHYISAFVDLLHLDRNTFQEYLDRKNIRELVYYLLRG